MDMKLRGFLETALDKILENPDSIRYSLVHLGIEPNEENIIAYISGFLDSQHTSGKITLDLEYDETDSQEILDLLRSKTSQIRDAINK